MSSASTAASTVKTAIAAVSKTIIGGRVASKPPAERMHKLLKTSCDVFETFYNPLNYRTGNKVLRKKFAGPTVASYYPQKSPVTMGTIRKAFPGFEFPLPENELFRMSMAEVRRRRGKGPPTKKDESAQKSKHRRR
ncbi:mitochondrial ribosomal subunit S27-domain-containing protein [Myxozyma melibiosi]|uniref:Small ribosomal subunit protein mS33 n=1 Tax=Myxozyma melibiosi TaxID=54550 RepID=A0ABR1F7T7_9ASCO